MYTLFSADVIILLIAIIIVFFVVYLHLKCKRLTLNNRLLKNNLRSICHDVHNYLTIINGSCKILEKKGVDKKYLIQILSSCKNIHDLSKFVQNYNENQILKPICVEETINEAVRNYSQQAELKKINFVINSNLGINSKILGNKVLLRDQVFANIISNALKFSGQNSTINIDLRLNDKGNICALFKDEGVGIDKSVILKSRKNIKVDSANGTEGEEGTGCGLSILFNSIFKLNASIDIYNNEKSRGTTVSIEFQPL